MMEPQKTELQVSPAEQMRSEFAAIRARADELRRDARIAERTATFLGAWMNGGRFYVPLPDGARQEVRPEYPRRGGPMQAFWNARSDAEYWARRMEQR